jgi:hypothetical protein
MLHRLSMLWPDGLRKALTFSYDDGVMQDLKLISLFRLYGLKGTFNLNSALFGQIDVIAHGGREYDHSHVPEEDIAHVYAGFEAAIHTAHHPHLTQLSNVNAAEEILADRAAIEALVRYPVRGMAYPFGETDARVKEIVRVLGVTYARGTRTTGDCSLPVDPYDWATSCHHAELEQLIEPFLGDAARASLLSVWGHAYEFDMTGTWDAFEGMLERLGGNDDVWYASNIEVFDYLAAHRALRFTADGAVVENPSATDVFLDVDGETLCIPGGERMEI